MSSNDAIQAVTFDFFDTLIHHRDGVGRGRSLARYLMTHGHASPDWHDGALYRVFERHAIEYSPDRDSPKRRRYLDVLAGRVFDELGHSVDDAGRHAEPIWEILGPNAFSVFDDARATLESLRDRGIRLALISNWHRGLHHFVSDLDLDRYFDHVIGSADCGYEKPDRRIFERARALLGASPARILHVGDSYEADYEGARAAGFHAVLLERRSGAHPNAESVIRSLRELGSVLS